VMRTWSWASIGRVWVDPGADGGVTVITTAYPGRVASKIPDIAGKVLKNVK